MSLTHTQAHSQIGYRRRLFSNFNRSGKLSASPSNPGSAWQSCPGGWSPHLVVFCSGALEVADRRAFLRVQGGPSGPHVPPAAYRFVHDGPGLGTPDQPHLGGPRGHCMVSGIPAQLERAGFVLAATCCRRGTRVCYRRERRGAWCGVRSEMALRCVAPRLLLSSYQCPGVVCHGGHRPLLGGGMA